jgi:hypothetical protein
MNDTRLKRLSRRLLSQLEEFSVHKVPSEYEMEKKSLDPHYSEHVEKRKRDMKVITSPKTKSKLEKWFAAKKIPIRFIYGNREPEGYGLDESSNVSPIGKPGVITYYYYRVEQEPPTAWMIAHNLGHAVYELFQYNQGSPSEVSREERKSLQKENPYVWEKTYNLMGRDPNRPAIYPTTKSQQRGKITEPGEAFYELFAQWVVNGHVVLDPRNFLLERELEVKFRNRIDYLAKKGAVVYNA